MTQNIVTAQRRKLESHIAHVNGAEMRESFRAEFDGVAGRYALGKVDGPEFTSVVDELIRDASGTVAGQDRKADGRESWATMPTDGSGRAAWPERTLWVALGVAATVVLAWLVMLAAGNNLITSPDASRVDGNVQTDMRRGTTERDRQMILEGAYLSWTAVDGCDRGTDACQESLREANANPYGITLLDDGSAIKTEDYLRMMADH